MSDSISLSHINDSGFVTVTLLSGRGIMGKNADGFSDPFCIIEIDSQVHFSKIKKATCDPTWNETYVFNTPMPLPSPFYLSISVWNQPKFSNGRDTKGAFLGQLQIDLGQIGRSESNGRFFELEKRSARSHVSGSLEMKIVMTSEEEAAKMKQKEADRALELQQAMQKQIDDEKNARSVETLRQVNLKVSAHLHSSIQLSIFNALTIFCSWILIPKAANRKSKCQRTQNQVMPLLRLHLHQLPLSDIIAAYLLSS
jgi:hypothetical protein